MEFGKEIRKKQSEYHKAKALGNESQAKELIDDIYSLAFKYYQQTNELIKYIKKSSEETTDVKLKKILSSIEKKFILSNEEFARELNTFVSKIL